MNTKTLLHRALRFGFVPWLMALAGQGAAAFDVRDTNGVITVAASSYRLEIIKEDFRYGPVGLDRKVIAPLNAKFGVECGGGRSVSSALISAGTKSLSLEVAIDDGERARVEIETGDHFMRFSVKLSQTNRILARIGEISQAFGLAGQAAFGWTSTEVTGFFDGHFLAQEPPVQKRLLNNFVISPGRNFAMLNMEKGMKLVRVRADDVAQGAAAAACTPALYYFIGSPEEIYEIRD